MNTENVLVHWRSCFRQMRRYLVLPACLLLASACERSSLAPVELKIDDNMGGYATGSSVANTYIIQKGETFFDVANKFNIDPKNLAKLNGINPPYNVKAGQVLKLPPEDPEALSSSPALYEAVKIEEQGGDKDKLDDKFSRMMQDDDSTDLKPAATTTAVAASATALASSSSKKTGSQKEADDLLSPKITKTASGTDIKKKESDKPKKSEEPAVEERKSEQKSSGGMIWPVDGKVISKFGQEQDGMPNDGIDIKASQGTLVKAVDAGEVIYAGNDLDPSFGNVVVVKHRGGLVSIYAYLGSIAAKQGMKVQAGQKVGTVGKKQLHLEIMKNNTPEDPEKYLKK